MDELRQQTMDFFGLGVKTLSVALLISCASSPKIAKNPQEEAALQARAKEVIDAGQTESAKAGGYDPIPFWQNRNKVKKKYVSHVGEDDIYSKAKKVYIMDFKVKFVRRAPPTQSGGLSFLDRMAEKSRTTYGLAERRWYVNEVVIDDATAQKITDQIFEDYKKRLTSLGFEIAARESAKYKDLQEYLASDKMIASPADGENYTRVYAPTGWKLEKSTYDVLGLSGAFGDTLSKLGEQVSRKIDDGKSIGVTPSYIVTYGASSGPEFMPYLSVAGNFGVSIKWYNGSFSVGDPNLQDATPYKFTSDNKGVVSTSGKTMAAVSALLTQKSAEYSSTELHEITVDPATFEQRAMLHLGYVNDIAEEVIRQSRDD